jgi:hypothetical protein
MRYAVLLTLLIVLIIVPTSAQHTIFIDVGNDTDYDWSADSGFTGPERLNVKSEINHYVRGGCWCVGCILDGVSGNCTVPVVFNSFNPGNLTVNDVSLRFEFGRLLTEVGYGGSYRWSEGGCWMIDYMDGAIVATTPLIPIPSDYNGGDCTGMPQYNYRLGNYDHPATEDALVDAVYRLLNETLDVIPPKGVVDAWVGYNENMTFKTEGRIGVQSMWGPLQMRLIVWS